MSSRPLGDRSNAEKREAPGGATGAKKVRAAADPSVEAFLKAELESVVAELGAHGDEQVRLLREQAQRGKDTIRSALAPRVAGAQASGAAALAPSRDTAAASAVAVTLRAASGPYSGTTFALRLAPGKQSSVAMIGRSTGKKFRDNGVSLPKDGEVSTTHARVELAPEHAAGAPAVAVVDADSTNGTSLDGVALVPGAPVALRSGATLRVGVTELQVEIAC